MAKKKKSVVRKLQEGIAETIDSKVNPVKFAKNMAKGIGHVGKGIYDQVGGVGQMSSAVRNSTNMAQTFYNPLNLINPVAYAKHGFEKTRDFVKGGMRAIKGGVDMVKGLLNHKEWYLNYPIEDLVGLNFGRRKSINNDIYDLLGMSGASRVGIYGGETTVAGALRLKLSIPRDQQGSFMQAISILYQKIRAANSGSVNYTPDDLAAYVLNVRSVRAAVMNMIKIVGLVNYVDPYDADLPRKLVDLATYPRHQGSTYYGINYTTVADNRANIINAINLWVNQLNTLLPIRLSLFDRTKWLMLNVFKDSNDVKSNTWQFLVTDLPLFTSSSGVVSNTSVIDFRPSNGTSFASNLGTILDSISKSISSVATDPTNVIIAGDIMKAFGDASFDIIPHIDVNYSTVPGYDESVLTQIQNATAMGSPDVNGTDSFSVNFNTNTITETTVYPTTAALDTYVTLNPSHIITNANVDNIDAGTQLSLTRLQAMATYTSSSSNKTVTYISCGSEIVSGKLVTYQYDYTYDYTQVLGMGHDSSADDTSECINAWSILDYAPLCIQKIYNSGASTYYLTFMFDFNNFSISEWKSVDILHQYATLSLLAAQSDIKRQSEFHFVR